MPYLEPSAGLLPYQSDLEDRAGNTSRAGAEAIQNDAGALRAQYVRLLYARGLTGATDQEAADALGIQRTTITPRRHELKNHVKWAGTARVHRVRGRTVPNKVWALTVFITGADPADALDAPGREK